MEPDKILVLGGAKSGKTDFALRFGESLGRKHGKKGLYIATAQPLDSEMQDRIDKHKQSRSPFWHTIEEPCNIWESFNKIDSSIGIVLVDCLTLWLTNILASSPSQLEHHIQKLLNSLSALSKPIILVSNEVGMGIVPAIKEARYFRDVAGKLHQRLASHCTKVFFVIAGIPVEIKGVSFTYD